MKNTGKIIVGLLIIAVILGVIIGLVKFFSGLVSSALNFVLGIVVIIALIGIVAWMFWYAKHARK